MYLFCRLDTIISLYVYIHIYMYKYTFICIYTHTYVCIYNVTRSCVLLSLLLQSALAPLEQVLSQEVPVGRQIGAFLLAGHHPGVPQHSHHIIRALQPAHVADTSAGYVQHYCAHQSVTFDY